MTTFRLSTKSMTAKVVVDRGAIINAAPIWRKFVGQPYSNLINWLERRDGAVKVDVLVDE